MKFFHRINLEKLTQLAISTVVKTEDQVFLKYYISDNKTNLQAPIKQSQRFNYKPVYIHHFTKFKT